MKLKYSKTIEIIPSEPFNFNATFFKPDHFTTNDHEFILGTRWQTLNYLGEKIGVKFEEALRNTKPFIKTTIFSSSKPSEKYIKSLKLEIIYRYNLNLDLKPFYKRYSHDIFLKDPIKNLYGMRPGHPSSLYEYLIIGIILQNASVRRSVQMFSNLLSKYGETLNFDGKELLCLWDIGRFNKDLEDELRSLKVGYRAKSIIRLDEQFSLGLIDEVTMRKLDVTRQKERLLELYGVGNATVWYLLFDVFHHWDIFEHISPWEQKLYSQMFFQKELVETHKLFKFINKYKEYKHLAIHYLWEDLWWRRYNGEKIDWLEKEIRL